MNHILVKNFYFRNVNDIDQYKLIIDTYVLKYYKKDGIDSKKRKRWRKERKIVFVQKRERQKERETKRETDTLKLHPSRS